MPRTHPAPPEQTTFQRAHEAALHLTPKELEELAAIALCRSIWLRGLRDTPTPTSTPPRAA